MKSTLFKIMLSLSVVLISYTNNIYGDLMLQKEIEPSKLEGAEYVMLDNG